MLPGIRFYIGGKCRLDEILSLYFFFHPSFTAEANNGNPAIAYLPPIDTAVIPQDEEKYFPSLGPVRSGPYINCLIVPSVHVCHFLLFCSLLFKFNKVGSFKDLQLWVL